jgi:HNH endonuclease
MASPVDLRKQDNTQACDLRKRRFFVIMKGRETPHVALFCVRQMFLGLAARGRHRTRRTRIEAMPRRPDTPCAGCGQLLWSGGRGSLPEGQRTCRSCRRETRNEPRPCTVCGSAVDGTRQGRTCSSTCEQVLRMTTAGHVVRAGRRCEVCGGTYRASCREQRTCSRACGVKVSRRRQPCRVCGVVVEAYRATVHPGCRPPSPRPPRTRRPRPCAVCGRGFLGHGAQRHCGYTCRVRSIGDRVTDLYSLACAKGWGGHSWRQLLIGYLRERDGANCAICRKSIRYELRSGPRGDRSGLGPSVDHVIPRSEGGSDDLANLRLAHWRCNWQRRARGGNEQLMLIG